MNASEAQAQLTKSGELFLEVFTHGSLSVEIYKPVGVDLQTPHSRDEVYVVIAGTGFFVNGDSRKPFVPGEFLFVPAGVAHRFEEFSDDFATWVFFYGPESGEAPTPEETTPTGELLADAFNDTEEMGCGDLMIALRKAMLPLSPGQILHLRATDLGAPHDIPAWCNMTGHSLLRATAPDYFLRKKVK
ncbi:cupin domain-containing protein [Armatimonas sp.]|uniref:cupin domain-containing protein n=1 Tax=Armatimonas sp. TaxID=1872638 RepID=UPI00286B2A44|nr:cupin domain-containing protein [Armatimonas sp.]